MYSDLPGARSPGVQAAFRAWLFLPSVLTVPTPCPHLGLAKGPKVGGDVRAGNGDPLQMSNRRARVSSLPFLSCFGTFLGSSRAKGYLLSFQFLIGKRETMMMMMLLGGGRGGGVGDGGAQM